MFDGEDAYWKVANVRTPAARKEYRCAECGRGIAVGERHEYFAGLSGDWGGWFYNRTCAHCVAARHWLSVECHGWLYGAVWEDMANHFGEQPGLALGRLLVGMRRQWRRWDGTLMPVPTKDEASPAPWHAKAAAMVRR